MSEPLILSPEMQRFADEQVHAGHFRSVDDVARSAFLLLRENTQRRESVRQELGQLFDEMDAGNAIPTEQEDFAQMVRARAAKLTA